MLPYNKLHVFLQCVECVSNVLLHQCAQGLETKRISSVILTYLCIKIREIKDSELDSMLSTRSFCKFQDAFIDLNVYGLCASCVRRQKSVEKAALAQSKKKIRKQNAASKDAENKKTIAKDEN